MSKEMNLVCGVVAAVCLIVGLNVFVLSQVADARIANAELRKDNEMLSQELAKAVEVCYRKFTQPTEMKPGKKSGA